MSRAMSLVFALAVVAVTAPSGRADNPVVKDIFTADPSALVHQGKVYLYTGHDEAWVGRKRFEMRDWRCFSSSDMIHWKAEGSPINIKTFPWAKSDAWASQAIERDGKFYWYAPVNHKTIHGFSIGVAVSDSPTGPFKDALGHALITNDMTKQTKISWDDIDPTIFIDDDGQAYLYWGNTVCHYVKLKKNMIEMDGPIVAVDGLKQFTEAPWICKHGSWYYLFYAQKYPEAIGYAMSKSAAGPWQYKGIILDVISDGEKDPQSSNTSHEAVIDFKGKSYFIYHNASLPTGGQFRRSVCINRLYYNADGTVQPIRQTSTGLDGIAHELRPVAKNIKNFLVSHSGKFVKITVAEESPNDSKWQIMPGLSDPSGVSFQAVSKPGFYLSGAGSEPMKLAKNDDTAAFKQSATFKQVPGLADAKAASLESVVTPANYVTVEGGQLKLSEIKDDAGKAAATFAIEKTDVE
jgi:beta-xylosidase